METADGPGEGAERGGGVTSPQRAEGDDTWAGEHREAGSRARRDADAGAEGRLTRGESEGLVAAAGMPSTSMTLLDSGGAGVEGATVVPEAVPGDSTAREASLRHDGGPDGRPQSERAEGSPIARQSSTPRLTPLHAPDTPLPHRGPWQSDAGGGAGWEGGGESRGEAAEGRRRLPPIKLKALSALRQRSLRGGALAGTPETADESPGELRRLLMEAREEVASLRAALARALDPVAPADVVALQGALDGGGPVDLCGGTFYLRTAAHPVRASPLAPGDPTFVAAGLW